MHTFMCDSCSKEYPLYFKSMSGWCYACHTSTIMPDEGLGDEQTASLCHTCNGYGQWVGGSIVNGYPTMTRPCNCCGGKGYMLPADVVRDNAYHNHAAGVAAYMDLKENKEGDMKNQYGVPVVEVGIACGACSYWEGGHKVIIHHATVAMVKLCSHRAQEAKANS